MKAWTTTAKTSLKLSKTITFWIEENENTMVFFKQEVRKQGKKSLRKDSTSKGCWSKVLGKARKTEQENWVSVAVRG